MKLYTIACEAVTRECMHAAAHSPHVVELSFLPFGLHNTPDELRAAIQQRIDEASGGKYDYILLGYGLCSRGTAALVAGDTPVVIPRAHDCITLFLGSAERYSREFREHPGTYYYSPGWIERKEGDVEQGGMGIVQERLAEERLIEYTEKYGEENARFLIEQERQWLRNYTRAAFVNMSLGDIPCYREFTRQVADTQGWEYKEIAGDLSLFNKLFYGDWDNNEFLIVKPGQRTYEDINLSIITAE